MIVRYLYCLLAGITLASCGTSKSVKELMASDAYTIKKVHIENKNSSYDNLISDYIEMQKSEDQRYAEGLARDTFMHMRKGPCLGHCPVFSITIYNNGNVKYEGVNHVNPKGIFQSKLEDAQLAKAKALVNKVNFVKLYSRYPGSVDMVSDVARTNLTLSDGRIKFSTVISYGEPESLKDIQNYLTELSKTLNWVQI